MKNSVQVYFLLSSLVLVSLFTGLILMRLKLHVGISYLIAVNFTVFLFYGYDKLSAKLSFLRVPEFVLHLLSAFGASPMAFIGQKLFGHKTSKQEFQDIFIKIVLVQLIVVLSFAGVIIYLS